MRSRNLFIHLLCLICLAAAAVAQASSAAPSKSEEEVSNLENAWLNADATGDANSFKRVIADDFVGSTFDGKVVEKNDLVPQGAPGGFAGAKPSDNTVRIFGDTAVLMGFLNMPNSQRVRVTLVCQKRAAGWQIIAAHLSRA